MKSLTKMDNKKIACVRIDPSLDQYDNVVLFPKKLEKANAMLKKSGIPKAKAKQQKS